MLHLMATLAKQLFSCYSSNNVSDETDIAFYTELSSLVRGIPKHNVHRRIHESSIGKTETNKFSYTTRQTEMRNNVKTVSLRNKRNPTNANSQNL